MENTHKFSMENTHKFSMETFFVPLSKLDAPALDRLTALHISVMHTLLSDLGAPMVRRYYEIAQADPTVLGLYGGLANDQMAGWVMGSPAPAELNAKLRQPLGWFAGQMIQLALRRPGVMLELLRSLVSASDANQLSPGQIELTYIGVAPKAQGQGWGKALLNAFSQTAFQAGYKSIALSVETDNLAAVNLYKRHGYKIIQTFHEGRFERHRMVLLPTPGRT